MHSRPYGLRARMCLALCLAISAAIAQPPGFTTKLLLKSTYSSDSSKEAIVASAELAPGASTGRHTHPGDEYGTVLEGQLEVLADGQEPRIVKAGESYHNAKGVVHESRNPGTTTTKLLSTFIIDKGQRLVQPVG
jgi:quercetin dioxygenase-like cupin family protein